VKVLKSKKRNGAKTVILRIVLGSVVLACTFLGGPSSALAQLKPQWMPGQMGLNAGILPSPGFSYINMDINYDAGTFNGPRGNAVPATGNYNVWAVENMLYYVPSKKVLGGNLGFLVVYPTGANGSLEADITNPQHPNLGATAGGSGVADLFIQPFTLGWHLKRVEFIVADGFMIPTGRYSAGASNNVGSGYFGNHFQTGTTLYVTKNKGTSVNLFTDWEVHGSRQGTNLTSKTPGQAFTDEWGIGQILPLKKNFSKLLQVGIVGYDQWQVTANGGTIPNPVPIGPPALPASSLPYYSVHAAGGQLNYILPAKRFSLFVKVEHEYKSSFHTLGNTIVFGGAWTFKSSEKAPPNK
jgi:hypothetical protein